MAAFACARSQYAGLARQNLNRPLPSLARKPRVQELIQRMHAKSIEAPGRARELVGVPAALDHQRLGDETHIVIAPDAEPQIVIFAYRSEEHTSELQSRVDISY